VIITDKFSYIVRIKYISFFICI